MENKNFNGRNESNDGKSKARVFWKNVGYVAIALVLAAVTVFVLNIKVN